MTDESRSKRQLKEQQRIMFGRPLARAALIVGLAVGALGLALAVGASAAYLVIPSYDERSADEGPPVVSVATRTQDGAPAARDARDAGAMTAPQAKQEERVEGVGRPPSASATTTPSASAAAVREAAVREAAVREAAVREEPVPEAPVREEPVPEEPVREEPVREAPVRDNDPPSGPSARSADGVGRPASATATPSVPATAPAKPPSTTWRSWWWRSGSGG